MGESKTQNTQIATYNEDQFFIHLIRVIKIQVQEDILHQCQRTCHRLGSELGAT